ncbi:MAG: amino acid racemase [FCB group bacterium]|nr:amino acid racemase [FCB group bacterium]
MKTVGIIGGLGPETTSEFYLNIIFSSYKKTKKARPEIIIASVPLPYKIERDAIIDNKGVDRCIPFLINTAKRLEKAGVDFIVMPCNSLHVFIKEIRNAVDVPVLSIIEETANFLKKNNLSKVGIISTSVTVQSKLYENAFKKLGIIYETPDEFQQVRINKFILNLVNGIKNNKDRQGLIHIIDSFKKKNVDCVVLACTDLQLLIPKHPTLKIFDTTKIFVNSTVEYLLK